VVQYFFCHASGDPSDDSYGKSITYADRTDRPYLPAERRE